MSSQFLIAMCGKVDSSSSDSGSEESDGLASGAAMPAGRPRAGISAHDAVRRLLSMFVPGLPHVILKSV